jgi:hypothetical protein
MKHGANESREWAAHDARVKSKNRSLAIELAGNLSIYNLAQHVFSDFSQIRLRISMKPLHKYISHL